MNWGDNEPESVADWLAIAVVILAVALIWIATH